MIISRTPFRISFFGGGTDYPSWFRTYGGAVLAATIDKYCYLCCRYLPPFFDFRYRIVYSRSENTTTVDAIEHPAVREVLRFLQIERGLSIHHDADLPARSGMGSSSAFTVGLLNALHALKGQIASQQQLAQEAIEIEQERLKETVGCQDQIMAAYGGINHITFSPNGQFSLQPMTLSQQRINELNAHLMLFYTGVRRTAAQVAETYVQSIETKKQQLRIMKALVEEGIAVLTSQRDIKIFGELLHEGWELKRSLSNAVSNQRIDAIYETARKAGALGGKITGAGGGGFLLLFVPPENQPAVKEALANLIHVPFHFDFSGSRIIYFDPETDYAIVEQERMRQPLTEFEELAVTTPPQAA